MQTIAEKIERLRQSPGDWELRIEVIEDATSEGQFELARQLVRDAPEDLPTPPEIQVRLHVALTQGVRIQEIPDPEEEPVYSRIPLEPVPPAPLREESLHPLAETVDPPVAFPDTEEAAPQGGLGALIEEDSFLLAEGEDTPGGGLAALMEDSELQPSEGEELPGGGLGALIEGEGLFPGDEDADSPFVVPEDAPAIDRDFSRNKWNTYQGNLYLVGGALPLSHGRASTAPARLSSLTLALIAHLVIFFLIGLVAVSVPRPKPPELVVSIPHERETDLTITKITRPTPEVKPSAATAQAVNLINTISSSSFEVPQVEKTENLMVSSTMPGLQQIGSGMDFSTSNLEASEVNFFGISGVGNRIIFIVDAHPRMLIDEKGGMTAYDKVKDEVGVMLANLNRNTEFNVLLYQGKSLVAFRDRMVPALPSNLRLAIEWMQPLNTDYERLGLRPEFGESRNVTDSEDVPLLAVDVAHYTKAIQQALEWQANAIFCITSGYENMRRSPTPEMKKKMEENPGTAGTINQADKDRWSKAVARTRAWLKKENDARRQKGISPKVVTNFNQLVQQVTGATPPQRQGGTPGAAVRIPPITTDDIEDHVKAVIKREYTANGLDKPSIHVVLFLGEEERIGQYEKHFGNLSRRNRGKLKLLKGLSALQDVTSG